MGESKVKWAALTGFCFYFFERWLMLILGFLSRKAYLLGIIDDPDGSYSYFGLAFAYTPLVYFYHFYVPFWLVKIINALFWASCFALVMYVWENRNRVLFR